MADKGSASPKAKGLKLSLSKGGKEKIVPTKQTMNFVHHQSSLNVKKLAPLLALLIIAAALFAEFGFMRQLDRKTAAYSELNARQEQLAVINARLRDYDEVSAEYGRLSYGWMTDKEKGLVSRMDVLELMEDRIFPVAVVENLAVNSNVLTMNLHGLTLEQASTMVKELEDSPLVASATVYSASAEEALEARIFISIVLTKGADSE